MKLDGPGLDEADLAARYADWLVRIDAMHTGARALRNPEPAFTPLAKPPAEARVALLTSAGAYVEGDEPFDVESPHGDATFRLIPNTTDPARIRFAHSHYDTARAEADPNVVLPLEPLADLVAEGIAGSAAATHVGMMGFNPDPRALVADSAPQVVDVFREDGVDVVVLTPG